MPSNTPKIIQLQANRMALTGLAQTLCATATDVIIRRFVAIKATCILRQLNPRRGTADAEIRFPLY